MATTTGTQQGKSSFAEEFLKDHQDANVAAVNAAWKAFGREGTISDSLISKIRRALGLTRNRTGNKAKSTAVTPKVTTPKAARKADKKTATSARATVTTGETPMRMGRQPSTTTKIRASERNRMLIAVERDLDLILYLVIELEGMTEAAELIRGARRVVSREIR